MSDFLIQKRPEREVYVPPPMDLIDDLNLLGFGEAME